MKNTLSLLGVILSLGSASTSFAEEGCDSQRLKINTSAFQVSIADDAEERARGLMGVEELPAASGMLFVFPSSAEVAFWMKDTLIPLDMIFIREDGVIAKVHDMAIPHDKSSIESGEEIKYVLEINGGLSEALNITQGDIVRSPIFGTGCPFPVE